MEKGKQYTVSQVAESLGVRRQSVLSRIGRTIEARKIGEQWVIGQAELDRLKKEKSAKKV